MCEFFYGYICYENVLRIRIFFIKTLTFKQIVTIIFKVENFFKYTYFTRILQQTAARNARIQKCKTKT